MKIVYVTNEHDAVVAVPKRGEMATVARQFPDAEVVTVDFMLVRDVLPITTAPCVFLLFDELEGDFDVSNLGEITKAVRAKGLKKGAHR